VGSIPIARSAFRSLALAHLHGCRFCRLHSVSGCADTAPQNRIRETCAKLRAGTVVDGDMERLRRENARLKSENELSKKTAIYFARESV
jgi:hypothetical protein